MPAKLKRALSAVTSFGRRVASWQVTALALIVYATCLPLFALIVRLRRREGDDGRWAERQDDGLGERMRREW